MCQPHTRVDDSILTEFLSEVKGAVSSTSHTTGEVYCFDTKLYSICTVEDLTPESFRPKGGGGTSFEPIFRLAAEPPESGVPTLHIILTDGYAELDLPEPDPLNSILWVISPGGLDSRELPHGDVTRIMV